ncbi:MAG: hypothetical protein JWM73_1118 [Solirubrobacterales bacterium]|nr:hypothetical protein [Solirubrobacterales bacterium]
MPAYGSPIVARLALVAALATATLAAPAGAAYPGRNGAVAYVAKVGGVSTLLARSGAKVRTVLDGNTISSPAWSPQGRRLAVVRTGPDGTDVWIVGHDGRGARQLTPAGGQASDPTWSPGGGEVAYADGEPGARHIYAMTADGAARRQLTSGTADERDPAWSVRGQVAYVVHAAKGDDLYVVAASGGKPRRLTRAAGNEQSPAWSPDGKRLALIRAGAVWTVGADGKGLRRVTAASSGPSSSPAWSPDGRRIVFAAGAAGRRQIVAVDPDGARRKALSTTADGRYPDWQPTGFDPVVAAAGDIACDPASPDFNGGLGIPRHCGQLRTSNLLLDQDLWAVLPLGDTQYSNGEYDKFLASYDPSWGRTKELQRPVIGNHEYATGATGYFDYFDGIGALDGPAGERTKGYYSYELGAWHVVALNSECTKVAGGCAVGSPQQRWLAADLAAHPRRCTLAMWHTPRFSSFHGGNAATAVLWQTLQDAGADVVLSGHHHFYERFAPQTPQGVADSATGIRQFTVGTGGGSIDDAESRLATSQKLIETTFGVLRLGLHPAGYDWRFQSASADPATDSGSDVCH